jgi:NADPH-dependent 2,4-dienoyl-CoA reductase/sulfur reductase-like enzyme
LVLVAQREVPADLIVEGTLHVTTTPPEDALQGLITANARLSVNTKNGEHLIDAFELDTRGGGFTAQVAIRQALERLEAELTTRLKEHP